MKWRLLTLGIVATGLPAVSGLAGERVVTLRDNFGEDLAFINHYLTSTWSDYYRSEGPLEHGHKFALDSVYVGRYDVNGDGRAELFVHVQFIGLCGSAGCPTYVFERRNGEWTKVSEVDGDPSMPVWVDPESGYKTVYSSYNGLRWTGETYEYLGAKEMVELGARMPPDFVAEGGCVEPSGDGFEYLREYVGTKKSMCLLYDPNVKPGLDNLLGGAFLHLRKNLDFRPTIDYSEGQVYLVGSRRPTERDWEERAMVMVSTYDGRAHVGIYSEGTRAIYSRAQQWSHLPTLFRAWARGDLDPNHLTAPPGIVWIGRSEDVPE